MMKAMAKFLKDLFVAFCLACEFDAKNCHGFEGCASFASAKA
jgi:hypothetical protein